MTTIIKRFLESRGFYLVAPTTSQKKEGSWYVEMKYENGHMYVCYTNKNIPRFLSGAVANAECM